MSIFFKLIIILKISTHVYKQKTSFSITFVNNHYVIIEQKILYSQLHKSFSKTIYEKLISSKCASLEEIIKVNNFIEQLFFSSKY